MKSWRVFLAVGVAGFLAGVVVALVGSGGLHTLPGSSTLTQERVDVASTYERKLHALIAFRDSLEALPDSSILSRASSYVKAHRDQLDAPQELPGAKNPSPGATQEPQEAAQIARDTIPRPETLIRALVVLDSSCRTSLDSARAALRIERRQVSRDSAFFASLRPRKWEIAAVVVVDAQAIRPGVEVSRKFGRASLGAGVFAQTSGAYPGAILRAGFSF